ncbi:DNA glycosylase [Annulohypoxylon maeteangense]|uniref:DNA glycosylase n=1 Tax=Annulohypoxylon maeteangense TaxID=1927788 RepID=UPI002007BAF1|nr:DNA glycosylase [Annulohypoxylon maeteangense]KAI0885622.1 DNA glycosylase [Annulohypoxylon maeteangense]
MFLRSNRNFFFKARSPIRYLIGGKDQIITYSLAQRFRYSCNSRHKGHLHTFPQGYHLLRPTLSSFKSHQVATMATRRSARVAAASATQDTTITPPVAPAAKAPRGRKRKAAPDMSQEDDSKENPEGNVAPDAPTTPKRRRARKLADPPATPTPSSAKLISEPATAYETPKPKAAAVRRLADPNATNATLLSPETSRVITRVIPPSTSAGETTTTDILEEACKHLISVDARMKPLIEKHQCSVFTPEGLSEKIDPFEALCSGIISQQVSGAAAKSIKQKFIDLFAENDGKFPHPSQVAVYTIERLRTAGLSQRKAEYVQGLAEKFTTGELSAQILADASYDVVLEKLIAVRGLGKWSVEMFACFGLKRMDIFSLGDLGVQRGMAAFVGRDVSKLKKKGGKWKYMSEDEMKEISDRFAPYRSVFMWYMWKASDTDVATLE